MGVRLRCRDGGCVGHGHAIKGGTQGRAAVLSEGLTFADWHARRPAPTRTAGGVRDPTSKRTGGGFRGPAPKRTGGGFRGPAPKRAAGGSRGPASKRAAGGFRGPAPKRATGRFRGPAPKRATGRFRSPAPQRATGSLRLDQTPASKQSRPAAVLFVQGDREGQSVHLFCCCLGAVTSGRAVVQRMCADTSVHVALRFVQGPARLRCHAAAGD